MLGAVVLIACYACSDASREAHQAVETAVVPEGLRVLALPGGNGVLEVTALTLRKSELIAALRNTGEVPACHAAFAVELFDHADQPLASSITGLLTQQFYRRTDGSGTIAACVAPGESTLAAITDLPPELAVEDVASIVYRCPYFALDVEAIEGLTIERVDVVHRMGRVAFTGTLANKLDITVTRPSVTVFPVSDAGRPLGVALSVSDIEIPPGGKWAFETETVEQAGTATLAFPAGALSQ